MKEIELRIQNKSSKPDNIVLKTNLIIEECIRREKELPSFLKDFFLYSKTSNLPSTRLEYLKDIAFFCEYLLEYTTISSADNIKDITIEEFAKITFQDVNYFIGNYCMERVKVENGEKVIHINSKNTSSRKKATLSTLFKFLYRNEQLKNNITTGLNPIKIPKKTPDSIKKLDPKETEVLLYVVQTGYGLVPREREFWEKTKLRDMAIITLFITYGLRLSELRELNISSFNFSRGEFKIFRKKDKEVDMPINKTCETIIKNYINNERPDSSTLNPDVQDALFLSLQNKRITDKAIRNLVKKYTSITQGVPRNKGFSPHKLRATTASNLIESGFSIYDVQDLMDHDNVTTTQLYAAHKKNSKESIVKEFEWIDDK